MSQTKKRLQLSTDDVARLEETKKERTTSTVRTLRTSIRAGSAESGFCVDK